MNNCISRDRLKAPKINQFSCSVVLISGENLIGRREMEKMEVSTSLAWRDLQETMCWRRWHPTSPILFYFFLQSPLIRNRKSPLLCSSLFPFLLENPIPDFFFFSSPKTLQIFFSQLLSIFPIFLYLLPTTPKISLFPPHKKNHCPPLSHACCPKFSHASLPQKSSNGYRPKNEGLQICSSSVEITSIRNMNTEVKRKCE